MQKRREEKGGKRKEKEEKVPKRSKVKGRKRNRRGKGKQSNVGNEEKRQEKEVKKGLLLNLNK